METKWYVWTVEFEPSPNAKPVTERYTAINFAGLAEKFGKRHQPVPNIINIARGEEVLV